MKHEKGAGALKMLLILAVVFIGAFFLYWSWHSGQKDDFKSSAAYTPDFILKDTQGEEFSSFMLEGKPAVLNFFTTWCPSCREEIPGFINVYNKYKESGFELIGVSLDANPEALPPFMKAMKINYKVLLGNMETVRAYGDFRSVPTTFFIGKDGKIKNVMAGYISKEVFEMEVQKLMN